MGGTSPVPSEQPRWNAWDQDPQRVGTIALASAVASLFIFPWYLGAIGVGLGVRLLAVRRHEATRSALVLGGLAVLIGAGSILGAGPIVAGLIGHLVSS
jgi:hypothetical protein